MGRDLESATVVSTPLDPHETYTKEDCPTEVGITLRGKVWAAHGILIHLSIWARPDLAHAVSVLGRYIHVTTSMGRESYTRLVIWTGEDRWTIADQHQHTSSSSGEPQSAGK
jgi:hypothetical protein